MTTRYDEERLGELLAALPPAPQGWVEAAQELPQLRRGLDELVARAEADEAFAAHSSPTSRARCAPPGSSRAPAVVDDLRRRLAR